MGSILVGALLQSSALRPIGRGRPFEAVLGGSAWTPAALFSAGEQGAWFDPSDFGTMWQDAAGVTPVTAVGQPVGRINDKSGRGNHATQPTAASRPVLGRVPATGRRNLLLATDTMSTQSLTVAAVAHTLSFTGTGTITLSGASTAGPLVGTGPSNRVSLTFTPSAASLTLTVSGSVTLAQLETGATATNYQRVVTAFDVTQAGVPDCHYLAFDGTDDFLLTGTITPGTDKAQVFAGVRKLGTAPAILVELSDNTNTNAGSFFIVAPDFTGEYTTLSHGSTASAASQSASITGLGQSPDTAVISTLADIAADSTIIRRNGLAYPAGTGDQGTGNYLAYPLYIGRRGGTSLPFNGQLFSLVVRFGANLPAAAITQAEAWVGQRVAPTVNAPQFGPDLILNGGFASSADWSPTGGWSISAGAARQASTGFGNIVFQAQALTAGATYAVTFTVVSISSGSISARFSGGSIITGQAFTAPGTYTVYIMAAAGNNQLDIVGAVNTVAVVDDVSMRRVT